MQKPNPPVTTDWADYRIADPEEFTRNMLRLMEEGGKAMAQIFGRADAKAGPYSAASEVTEAAKIICDVAQQWMSDPSRALEAQGELVSQYLDVWQNTLRRMM